MWVLGLVILIDQADQNILRGVIPQLKSDFGIGDGEIGLLLSIFVLVNGLVTVPGRATSPTAGTGPAPSVTPWSRGARSR